MIKTHFEIGKIKQLDEHGNTETQSVFWADTLSECIKEFKKQNYNLKDYFIDVWEAEGEGISKPIADINLGKWIFDN